MEANWLPPGRLVAAAADEQLWEAAAPLGEHPAGVQVDHPDLPVGGDRVRAGEVVGGGSQVEVGAVAVDL